MKLISQEMRNLAPECAVIKHAASPMKGAYLEY